MPQLMVNKKNRREAVKNAPFNRKGKDPENTRKYLFQDRIYSYRISLGKAGYLPGAKA